MISINKKQFLMITIPILSIMGAYIWFVPIHNLLDMPNGVTPNIELYQYEKFDKNTVVVYPIFTQYAYSKNGFYDYYHKICDQKCLTVPIYQNNSNSIKLKTDVGSIYWINPTSQSSENEFNILKKLNYHFITDMDIDKNPKILDKYSKIILLHNEYVTEKEYQALNNHTKIIYLYPNALYAKISVDYNTNTMKLLYGHGYPNQTIGNAFLSGTHADGEYDFNCKNMFWYQLHNGIELSCYPEKSLIINEMLLKMAKPN